MSKSKKYIVIKKGVCLKGIEECKIDEEIHLSDGKAASLVGKIMLAKDFGKQSESTAELQKQVAQLTEANAQLTEQQTESTEQLQKQVAQLTKANAQLTEQLTKLTDQLTAKGKK